MREGAEGKGVALIPREREMGLENRTDTAAGFTAFVTDRGLQGGSPVVIAISNIAKRDARNDS